MNFAPLNYLNGLFCNRVDDEKLSRAKARMSETLDRSVSASAVSENVLEEPGCQYGVRQGKVIDLSKLDVDSLRNVIKSTPYKALEIDDLRMFIERALEQLINKNCTRVSFSQRYKNIIDNLYIKVLAAKCREMGVDWYKDEQPRTVVLALIKKALNDDLPECYDRVSFNDKVNLLFRHFVDMAAQGYGWTA